jgi:hypothetical protein
VIFLKDPMKRARYRIPGESISTRWRGAKDQAAAKTFFPGGIRRSPYRPNLSCSRRERQTESVAEWFGIDKENNGL